MQSANIEHYLDLVRNPYGRFRSLKSVRFATDGRGAVDFWAGGNAVVFKASADGREVAIKCYTKRGGGREKRQLAVSVYFNSLNFSGLNKFEYRTGEAFVFDDLGQGAYCPVLLSDWVEGRTLRGWLTEKCRTKDRKALAEMARRFTGLALEILDQEWAHGDLKPDNIIVTPQNELRLIDYDSAFIPALAGTLSPELGTPGFQHPLRDARYYDRHLDDYSIALLAAALYALAEFPEEYDEADDDKLLFDPRQAVAGRCEALHRIKAHWIDCGQTALYRLAATLGNPSPEIPDLPRILEQVTANRDGNYKGSPPAGSPEIYRENGFYGYRLPSGERLTEAVYDDAEVFSGGLALVRIGKKRYYIGNDGGKRIDVSGCDRADSFSEGLAAVRKGRKWGYIAPDGTWAVSPRFGGCRPFREGLGAVEQEGLWGYIDGSGLFVIGPRFDSAFDFREGAAVVSQDGRFGYIDRRGNWLAEPVYTFASGLRNGTATAEREGMTITLNFASNAKPIEV